MQQHKANIQTSSNIVIKRLNGIDVSHHNKEINWDLVFSQTEIPISFVWLKATEGRTFISPTLKKNWQSCIENPKITLGVYHFFKSAINPITQAQHFCQQIEKLKFEDNKHHYSLDLEDNSGKKTPKELGDSILAFLDIVKQKFPKAKPYIYTSTNFCQENLKNYGEHIFKDTKLWIARYYNNTTSVIQQHQQPYDSKIGLPRGFKNWDIWQYTECGRIQGITSTVDLNIRQVTST
jgi:lysozyme